jgi:hypothetical protein
VDQVAGEVADEVAEGERVRLSLRQGDLPAAFGIIQAAPAGGRPQVDLVPTSGRLGNPVQTVVLDFGAQDQWTTVSYFLFDQWAQADASVDWTAQPPLLRLRTPEGETAIPLDGVSP